MDHLRIHQVIGAENRSPLPSVDLLRKKLEKAEVVFPDEIPADVITMNSQVNCFDNGKQCEVRIRLVYPGFEVSRGDVSVLSPIGAAVLGLSVGQEIHWWPKTSRCLGLRIVRITYQPEANGQYYL